MLVISAWMPGGGAGTASSRLWLPLTGVSERNTARQTESFLEVSWCLLKAFETLLGDVLRPEHRPVAAVRVLEGILTAGSG